MRVSEASMREAWLRTLGTTPKASSRARRTRFQPACGLKAVRGSDRRRQSLDLSRALAENSQYSRNSDLAANRLGAEETTLASVGDVLQRLHELAVEAKQRHTDQRDNAAASRAKCARRSAP